MKPEEFEESALNVARKMVMYYAIGFLVVTATNVGLARWTDIGRDDTDPPSGRSDMRILTDNLTGCQYLNPSRGGATPRLTADGKHICRAAAAMAPEEAR